MSLKCVHTLVVWSKSEISGFTVVRHMTMRSTANDSNDVYFNGNFICQLVFADFHLRMNAQYVFPGNCPIVRDGQWFMVILWICFSKLASHSEPRQWSISIVQYWFCSFHFIIAPWVRYAHQIRWNKWIDCALCARRNHSSIREYVYDSRSISTVHYVYVNWWFNGISRSDPKNCNLL